MTLLVTNVYWKMNPIYSGCSKRITKIKSSLCYMNEYQFLPFVQHHYILVEEGHDINWMTLLLSWLSDTVFLQGKVSSCNHIWAVQPGPHWVGSQAFQRQKQGGSTAAGLRPHCWEGSLQCWNHCELIVILWVITITPSLNMNDDGDVFLKNHLK